MRANVTHGFDHAGLAMHARARRVEWGIGATFGLLGSVGAVLGSRASAVVDVRLQLDGFVLLLLAAAYGMLRRRSVTAGADDAPLPDPQWGRILLLATGVGFITGFFGVGGGFIVVPALVVGLAMPIRRASATALVVIIVNTLTSLVAHGTGHLTMATTEIGRAHV